MDNLPDIKELWQNVLKTLEGDVGLGEVEMWLRPIKPLFIEDETLRLEVPDSMIYNTVKERYEEKIINIVRNSTSRNFKINYSMSLTPSEPKPSPRIEPAKEATQNRMGYTPPFAFNPNYTFETFIEGASNRFAYASAVGVSQNPGKSNPFFIYSAPGLGKTHLLHAIANETFKSNPSARIIYIASETFVNEYIENLQNKTPETFRNKYRKLDCLLLDDIQFLVGKDRSVEEFFHTFNSLFESKKQIVVTSDRPPKDLALDPRMVSRFLSGLAVDIKMPDLETRIAILRQKKELHKFVIPDDVITFIAENVKKNIRELEGCLITVGNYYVNMRLQPTIDGAKDIIKDHITPGDQEETRITIEIIKTAVAEKYNMEIKDFKSPRRGDAIAFPRQIAMFLACELTEMSLPEIGSSFNRDHTTVMFGRDKIKQLVHTDPYFNEVINQLITRVKAVSNSVKS
ncbi:MAG: chromosomal replication initiator protein DnaA [Elusimicrobia bacterium]|nr:chromosomal replication initiator protein DnaA [Elusimicrobiota bacterium]